MFDLLQLYCTAGCLSFLSIVSGDLPLPLISWVLKWEHFQSFKNFPRPGLRLTPRPRNKLKHAAVSLSIKMPPYYILERGKRMSEVVPCYLETLAQGAMGSLGRGQFHPPYSMNDIMFLQSFLEVIVVRARSCSGVDPCTGSGVGALMLWNIKVLLMPSTRICRPGNMINVQACCCVFAFNDWSDKSAGDINQML